ncbi:MAG: hypothetical protein ABR985_09345 [Methanotrichaceae archaeon]
MIWQRREAGTRYQEFNPRLMELGTAKQILVEVFHFRPWDVDEMTRVGFEEKSWSDESWQEEEEIWQREYCLGE